MTIFALELHVVVASASHAASPRGHFVGREFPFPWRSGRGSSRYTTTVRRSGRSSSSGRSGQPAVPYLVRPIIARRCRISNRKKFRTRALSGSTRPRACAAPGSRGCCGRITGLEMYRRSAGYGSAILPTLPTLTPILERQLRRFLHLRSAAFLPASRTFTEPLFRSTKSNYLGLTAPLSCSPSPLFLFSWSAATRRFSRPSAKPGQRSPPRSSGRHSSTWSSPLRLAPALASVWLH